MEDQQLKLVAQMMQADDPEMKTLGGVIFLESNPTDEDIDRLNNVKGYPSILYTRQAELVKEVVELGSKGNHNIF